MIQYSLTVVVELSSHSQLPLLASLVSPILDIINRRRLKMDLLFPLWSTTTSHTKKAHYRVSSFRLKIPPNCQPDIDEERHQTPPFPQCRLVVISALTPPYSGSRIVSRVVYSFIYLSVKNHQLNPTDSSSPQMTKLDTEETGTAFCVSAPGKVIIYGEHAAVFGKPAIAAALSLRAYLQVIPSKDPNTITLDFPDIGLSQSWNKHDIPWDDIQAYVTRSADLRPCVTAELVPEITDLLSDALDDIDNRMHYVLCHCFLYLYVHLCSRDTVGMHFTARSTLPIGAGLGSSASTAVCLASSMAFLGGHIERPVTGLTERIKSPHNKHHSHSGSASPADFIDEWSFVGEKCFHGNPSGIDNAVATHGGAVMFQRTVSSVNPNVRTNMRNFPPIKLLLTNTKVPRSTAELVGGVGQMHLEFPLVSQSILDAMGHLANEAYQLMIRPGFAEEELKVLQKLVNINHGLLVSLGVSHPTLEQIKVITDTNKIGATKLTGAGGGGCAITLIGSEVAEDKIQATIKQFEAQGFETYETSLGGKGVGLLHEDDVSDEAKVRLFSSDVFRGLESRKEIESLAGVEHQTWKFW